jgi:hypothetical protein
MKLPEDILIPREKLTDYLLLPQQKNDKSAWLASAGFTLDRPELLEQALRELIRAEEAYIDREDEYGIFLSCSRHIAWVTEKSDRRHNLTEQPCREFLSICDP